MSILNRSIDNFRVRPFFVKKELLVLVNIICAFRGIVTSIPMLSEWFENYDAILHESIGKWNFHNWPPALLSWGNCDGVPNVRNKHYFKFILHNDDHLDAWCTFIVQGCRRSPLSGICHLKSAHNWLLFSDDGQTWKWSICMLVQDFIKKIFSDDYISDLPLGFFSFTVCHFK